MLNNDLVKYLELYGCKETILNPKVTVVIPAYNAENYIIRNLKSVIEQTLKEIEIIIVNDGSIDNTADILSLFEKYDSRIKVISQRNSGVSVARNVGVQISTGEYISFLDSDDWLDLDFFEKLYNAAILNGSDISAGSMIRKREHSQKYRICYDGEHVYKSLQDKFDALDIPRCCYSCSRLYKRELIVNKPFKEDVYFEDVLWIPNVVKDSNKLVTVGGVHYYYWVNANSIVKTTSQQKQFDSYIANKKLVDFCAENNVELSKKQKILTKRIHYIMNIPVIRVKECNKTEKYMLFNLVPIYKVNISDKFKVKKDKKVFFFKNIDSHYVIELFKFFRLRIKNNTKFDYIPAREYGLTVEKRSVKLIVSLATYPARINTVYKTINTLLNQTLKPDKLILWLAYEQFDGLESLPKSLLDLQKYGLEIKFTNDLKSYKKLVPALKEFPDDIIVTADDDLYYQNDWLESLYNAYLKNPNVIHTKRAVGIKAKDKTLYISPHFSNKAYNSTFCNQLMGGSGVLYPPNTLYKDICNEDLIKTLVPTHDDIYFWVMAILNKTKINLVNEGDSNIYQVEETENTGLCKNNNDKGVGMSPDMAFEKIFNYYPEALLSLQKDSL